MHLRDWDIRCEVMEVLAARKSKGAGEKTNRKLVSEEELLKLLNSQLAEDEDCRDCRFTSIERLAEEDKDGCNWYMATLRCSGVPGQVCMPTATRIVARAKEKYNVVS